MYYWAKKHLYDKSIQMGEQTHLATWLASAAFMCVRLQLRTAYFPLSTRAQPKGLKFTLGTYAHKRKRTRERTHMLHAHTSASHAFGRAGPAECGSPS